MSAIVINNCLHFPCLYREGVYLRHDVYHSQLKVYLLGLIFSNEDFDEFPSGFSDREYQHIFGSCASIAQAIQIANTALLVEDFTEHIVDHDVDYFLPQIVVVRDHDGRLVLVGQISSIGISWLNPLDPLANVWNHDSSCNPLFQAQLDELRQVDPFWLRHSVHALNATGSI